MPRANDLSQAQTVLGVRCYDRDVADALSSNWMLSMILGFSAWSYYWIFGMFAHRSGRGFLLGLCAWFLTILISYMILKSLVISGLAVRRNEPSTPGKCLLTRTMVGLRLLREWYIFIMLCSVVYGMMSFAQLHHWVSYGECACDDRQTALIQATHDGYRTSCAWVLLVWHFMFVMWTMMLWSNIDGLRSEAQKRSETAQMLIFQQREREAIASLSPDRTGLQGTAFMVDGPTPVVTGAPVRGNNPANANPNGQRPPAAGGGGNVEMGAVVTTLAVAEGTANRPKDVELFT